MEIKIKYADVLLKVAPLPKRQAEALQIYNGILTRNPGRDDVRRKQMELKIAMGRLRDEGAEADLKILLNMDENKNDGNLLFLMGRCCEDGKNDVDAVKWYRKAIEHNAPQRIEAYQRLATLLRGRLNRTQRMPIKPSKRWSSPPPRITSSTWSEVVIVANLACRRAEADFQKALELAEGSA